MDVNSKLEETDDEWMELVHEIYKLGLRKADVILLKEFLSYNQNCSITKE